MNTAFQQRGGIYSMAFMLILFAASALLAMKVIPVYLNQQKVDTIVGSIAEAPQYAKKSPYELRKVMQKRWDVDDVNYLKPADVGIGETRLGGRALTYKYEVRQNLFLNWDLVITFEKSHPMYAGPSG